MLRNHFVRFTVIILLSSTIFACNSDSKTAKDSAKKEGTTKENSGEKSVDTQIKNILFFGTSLTAGLGLDVSEAYPALIQKKIDSLDKPYKVINAGLSGETSAAGNTRIDWLLSQPVDILVMELGANDGLRGIPLTETIKNLQEITDKVKKKYPDAKILLAGMQMPPSMGADYTNQFKAIFPDLAKKNNMVLVPFLLQGVGGIPKLNQQDGIHPTAAGQKILAENVWAQLKGML